MLPHLKTVRHVHRRRRRRPAGARGGRERRRSTRYDDLLAGQPDDFDWPELDERDAAALCYTSRHHRQPQGRRLLAPLDLAALDAGLHGRSVRPSADDRVLPIVPMFHAMAWGLPYAAFMSGASLLMPDRFLQAEPLAAMIAAERPTLAGAVPTIWNDLLRYLDAHREPTSRRCAR